MIFPDEPSAAAINVLLREAGFASEDDISVETRDKRWLARLPNNRVIWLAASDVGWKRLTTESATLQAIAKRCSFVVPKVLFTGEGWEIRSFIPGLLDPFGVRECVRAMPELGRRIGAAVGEILAEQHSRVLRTDLAPTLPNAPAWPESKAWVMERLPEVVDNPNLIRRIGALFDTRAAITVSDSDNVLVHGDLGLHNTVFDPDTLHTRAVFDYDSAAWTDRHTDFRYCILDLPNEPVLHAACDTYEAALGLTLDHHRIALDNALCAASFLAFRHGVAPETNWCGRTLAGDMEWIGNAMKRVNL